MTQGEYWSIGEVLSLLQDEFPEITISKIRFLESQGLIEPERTPSGYRRFYQSDFDLLQWILVQQRDHYLPLKVIRDRIQSGDTEQGLLDFSGGNGDHPRGAPSASAAETVEIDSAATASSTGADPHEAAPPAAGGAEVASVDTAIDTAEEPTAEADQPNPAPADPTPTDRSPAADSSPDSTPSAPAVPASEPLPPLALTRDELAESSGCPIPMISDLERYGLVKGRKAGPTVLYDNTALLIARIAAQFATFGLEPRHLRTFLIGAEREVGLVHQVVEPMLHRRDEETRRKAHETLEDLTDLAGSLRSILMRQAIEELLPKH